MALPSNSYDLTKELNALWPPRCIRKGETLEDAHRYAGAREVIEYLIANLEDDA